MKIAITGCGSEGAMGIIKSLRHAYGENVFIIGLDTDPYIANQAFVDKFIIPPKRDADNFLEFIIAMLVEREVDVFWPIPTRELDFFALNKLAIENATPAKVMVSALHGIATANHKGALYRALEHILPESVPEYIEVFSKEEMKEAVFKLGYPEKRICLKKPVGAGAQGFRILDAKHDKWELLVNSAGSNIATWEEEESALDDKTAITPYLVTEYLPGEEWDSDALCDQGQCLAIVTKHHLKMHYGMGQTTAIKQNQLLEEYTREIIRGLKLDYINQVSFKKDCKGDFKVIEINPRVPGTIVENLFVNTNFAQMAVDLLMGKTVVPYNLDAKTDVLVSRYWSETIIARHA